MKPFQGILSKIEENVSKHLTNGKTNLKKKIESFIHTFNKYKNVIRLTELNMA